VKGKIVGLEAYFCNEVLTCALRLQPADMDGNGTTETSQLDTSLSLKFTFGEELLTCIKDLPAAQVA